MNPEKYAAAISRPENNQNALFVSPLISDPPVKFNIPIKKPYTTLEKILLSWTIITHLALAIALVAHYMN